jgi:hypothetical protein
MKKILLLLLFISASVNAQIVNIPDAAFKSKLLLATASTHTAATGSVWPYTVNTFGVIDTDGDGQIQLSEAQAVTYLSIVNAGILSFDGIQYFTNLKWLNVQSNLQNTVLDVTALTQLLTLNCSWNNIDELDITTLTNLTSLDIHSCNLSTLDVTNCTHLEVLEMGTNNISALDLTHNNDLKTLNIGFNNFTALDVSNMPNLERLTFESNNISSIDLSNNTQLIALYSGHNPTFIDITGLDLLGLSCIDNLNPTIDVSHCMNLTSITCGGWFLENLYLKNGRNESIYFSDNTPNLQFICADEGDVPAVQTALTNTNASNAVLSSYCSFVPGGNYNTITGSVHYDLDGNGCDAGDVNASFVRVNLASTLNNGASYTNANGNYVFYTGTGNHTLTPQLENPDYFNVAPISATANFPLLDNSTQVRDFCLTANGIHPDLEIVLVPIGSALPGFNADYKLIYRNKGNQAMSGFVTVAYDGNKAAPIFAVPATDAQTATLLTWNYSNLLPFETRAIDFRLLVNSPADTPPVNAGDILSFTAAMNNIPDDITPDDNVFHTDQIVLNALDPNDKTCLEGEIVTPEKIGDYLHYNINFENIGTNNATNVVVKDLINTAQFDLSTLQIMYASHPVRVLVTANKVEFIFENINLPSSAVSPIGGHGNVLFKIKTLPTLNAGDMVTNTANIYFDYNHPIETNEARTTFALLKTQEFITDDSVRIYPNPAKDKINIKAQSTIDSVTLFDVQGRILQTSIENSNNTTLDISGKSNGIYFLKITTADGIKVEQIIKE